MSKTIEQLKADVTATKEAHTEAVNALHAAQLDAYQWRVGDIIVNTKTGEQVMITGLTVVWDFIRVSAVRKKNNGKWSRASRMLWDHDGWPI